MSRKHRKIKKHYTIAVTSDYSVDKTKYYRSRFNIFRVSLVTTIMICLIGVGLTAFEFYELNQMDSKLKVLRDIINEQDEIIDKLGDEKSELTSQNQILNNTVAMALEEKEKADEEDAKKHLPTGFPLTGSATIVDISVMDEDVEEPAGYFNYDVGDRYNAEPGKAVEENPISVFEMSSISDVVPTTGILPASLLSESARIASPAKESLPHIMPSTDLTNSSLLLIYSYASSDFHPSQ